MKDTLKKYKSYEGNKITKISQLFLITVGVLIYLYIVLLWTPSVYVSILGVNQVVKYIKIIITIILAIYIAVQLDLNFVRAPKFSKKQINDYELWNKFFLHFAFMKTGSGSEKSQVLEVLRYLEDSTLKQTLTEVYEENTSLKEAHNEIIEKYPYPQVKTFFAEAEDVLVKGVDGNHLMQKTALNIDKYINDISNYEENKINNYKMSSILLVVVLILTLVTKIGFSEVFINFSELYIGYAILVCYFVFITKQLVKVKTAVNSSLIQFGGERDE